MKKFKVIEKSLFLENNEMGNSKGGINSCPGTYNILCTNLTTHATCNGGMQRYLWGPCVANHYTCGLLVAYTEFCQVYKTCGIIEMHGPTKP